MTAMNRERVRFYTAGEGGIVVDFGQAIRPEVYEEVCRFVTALRSLALPEIREIVPSYCSVMVYFDVLQVRAAVMRQQLTAALQLASSLPQPAALVRRVLLVPVCYEGVLAPDLEYVLRATGLVRDELLSLHTAQPYLVYMMGFMPGFPYMGGLPFTVPRQTTPRRAVPPGSVGIGANQTGIYTIEGPGEWWLVGRTPLRIFDAARAQPFLLQAGDYVQFQAVDIATYFALRREIEAGRYTPEFVEEAL